MYFQQDKQNKMNLQATLSAGSAVANQTVMPHHPITCQSALEYDEEGNFSCEHATVGPDDERTHACVVGSIAVLLFECLHDMEVKKYGRDVK